MNICDNKIIDGLLFCLIPLVAVLYYLKWDYTAPFHKPKRSEIKLAIILFVGYLAYALIISSLLAFLSLSGSDIVSAGSVTLIMLLSLFCSLMGGKTD
ncbi:hypothetical protein [Methanosphaera sp. BMS]|uniref:hypothetical protein n=1 Tax=Methanosphaera sp. BMS TaxID=1789762 RepID=UPI0013A696E0|nr:hypothetical protein [Methanosphaera sp. BMS]